MSLQETPPKCLYVSIFLHGGLGGGHMHMPRLSARRARSVATAKASATSYKPARPIADDGRGRHERKRASGGGRANTTATASDLAASVSRSFSRSRCTVAGRGRPIRGGSGRDGDQWERGGFSNSISPLQFINVNFFFEKILCRFRTASTVPQL